MANKKKFREPSVLLQSVDEDVKTFIHEKRKRENRRRRRSSKKTKNESVHHVRNVYAPPSESLELASFHMSVYKKTDEERESIETALRHNFVFDHLDQREQERLVLAFEEYSVPVSSVIIQQGDEGNYFYIIKQGACKFEVNGNNVGEAHTGDSFGELALLYNCPRAATVTALVATDFFRVDQKTFRYILATETERRNEEKVNLLSGVEFLKDLSTSDRDKLAAVMTPIRFHKGDYLVRKGETGDEFFIIQEGTLRVMNITSDDQYAKYEDVELKAGDCFGEQALVTGKPRAANVIAESDGAAFKIDKQTFQDVLGNLNELIVRSLDKVKLAGIQIFVDAELDSWTISSVAALIADRTFPAGTTITEEGESTEAALYLLRSGLVELITSKKDTSESPASQHTVESGGYFGTEMVRWAGECGRRRESTMAKAPYTITALQDCVCGVLTLAKLQTVVNTLQLGDAKKKMQPCLREKMELNDLQLHKLLGAGTLGQVWLVTKTSDQKQSYALKIQSKYELVKEGQAKAVVNEKNVMAKMHHPFLCHLVSSFQNEQFVCMVMNLYQGGELYAVIHSGRREGLVAVDAKFYAAAIADGLAHMHKRGYVYRDLKPENVMIDGNGYPVIVDFGFVKYIAYKKTYTLCGTPLYLPPEIILNRGYNQSVDHWSLGVLIYEMLTGATPFYERGMDQMELYESIVKSDLYIPLNISKHGARLLRGLLSKDATKRLGSLRGGEDDILHHDWFARIDFEKLCAKEVKAPFVPKISGPMDASNFENWDHLKDKTKRVYPKLSKQQAKIFEDF